MKNSVCNSTHPNHVSLAISLSVIDERQDRPEANQAEDGNVSKKEDG